MQIDIFNMTLEKIQTLPGDSLPLGLSIQGDMANFAVFSSRASSVYLALFFDGNIHPEKEIPMHRTGDIWHVAVRGATSKIEYSFRCEGPHDEKRGLLFNNSQFLTDPYAKILHTRKKWQQRTLTDDQKPPRAILQMPTPFDWEGDLSPKIPYSSLIIYEMHVRGFTQHPNSQASAPGTFLGIIEKIPYLKKLGVNAIELMPIFEWDESYSRHINPKTGQYLPNYWGYDSLHFFAPMARFASGASFEAPLLEFKQMVRELHKNGIEVLLDVVYNHTGEGKEHDYYIHFRGLDNSTYYMIDEQDHYRNFTGCGNTVNCNHPTVKNFILDSLRYWVQEMHVDGFRFDLASILTRDPHGHPTAHAPLLQAIASDPEISKVKLIAEAWDAAGLYQVGSFPQWGPWSEWNGPYRDIVRRFIKGTDGQAGSFAKVLSGSQMLYPSPQSSINFVTAHDGFSLRDLVSYQQKHNLENGEMNRDGTNQNDNWNCGEEGPTTDLTILRLRERQMRNFLLALFLSQGIPMLLMGDEYGHTRKGNNNPYGQDNELNWFDWEEMKKNQSIVYFVSSLISFRKKQATLSHTRFLTPADVEWHGMTPHHPDWSDSSRLVAYTLKGEPSLFIAFNANPHSQSIALPEGKQWHQVVHTALDWDHHHFLDPSKGPHLPAAVELLPYSALLAQTL